MKANFYGRWSAPKLVEYKGNLKEKWFVKFTWYGFDGTTKSIQSRGSINKQKTVSGRRREAAELIIDIEKELVKDYNPDTKDYKLKANTPEEAWQIKTFDLALTEALELKRPTISKDSYIQYEVAVSQFIRAYKSLGDTVMVKDVKRSTITSILSHHAAKHNATNKTYNRLINYVSPVVTEIMERADLPYSPFSRIKKRPVAESEGFIPPSRKEMPVIKEAFANCPYPEAVNVLETVFHTRIRPKEVLLLTIYDINIIDEIPYFKIVPDLNEGNSKTKNIRLVPINKHLWKLLQSLNLHLFPSSWLIFGRRGNKYYVPGPKKINRKHLTKLWREIIKWPKSNGGLGLKCDMYGIKAKGIDDSIDNGISLRALQYGSGHSKESMTAVYGKRSLLKQATDEIIEKSPEF